MIQAVTGDVDFASGSMSDAFDGAVISDMIPPIQKISGGKSGAKFGNLVFDGKGKDKQHAVYGDLKSNGVVVYDGSRTVELTDENAGGHPIAAFFQKSLHLGEGREKTRAWVRRVLAHDPVKGTR